MTIPLWSFNFYFIINDISQQERNISVDCDMSADDTTIHTCGQDILATFRLLVLVTQFLSCSPPPPPLQLLIRKASLASVLFSVICTSSIHEFIRCSVGLSAG